MSAAAINASIAAGHHDEALRTILATFRAVLPKVWRGLDEATAQDMLQSAALRTWRFAKRQPLPNDAYLRLILLNTLRDHYRRRRRERAVIVDVEDADAPSSTAIAELDAGEIRQAFDRVVQHAATLSTSPTLARDATQLWGLASGELAMATEIANEASDGDLLRAQNRLFQRHSRTRTRLESAVEDLLEQEKITSEDARFYRMILRGLVRCQSASSATSKDM